MSIAQEAQPFSVLVFVPGARRPDLLPGQSLRLELAGYAYIYQDLTIDRIDDEIIGPQELRRVLGREVGDAVSVNGPVVVVHAALKGTSFTAAGRSYRYYDGMYGVARARVRSERILSALVPGVRLITERQP
jgi:hypothetical protein